MKKLLLLIFLLNTYGVAISQEHFEIEGTWGGNLYNLMTDKSLPEWSRDYQPAYGGYGMQTGLDFWLVSKQNRYMDLKLGVGYANIWQMNLETITGTSLCWCSYASLRGGAVFSTFWKPMTLHTGLSTYVGMSKESLDVERYQKRFFTNVDAGFGFNLGSRFDLRASSSLSLLPMFRGDGDNIGTGFDTPPTDGHAEVTGFNISIAYKFKENEKRILPQREEMEDDKRILLEVSQGAMFFDAVKSDVDVEGYFQGVAAQSAVGVSFHKNINQRLSAYVGTGFTQFRYSDYRPLKGEFKDAALSYANLNFGFEFASAWDKINWTVGFSNFLRLGGNKILNYEDQYISYLHQRHDYDGRDKWFGNIKSTQKPVFTNLDLGFRWNVKERLSVSVTTPITLSPIFSSNSFYHFKQDEEVFDNNGDYDFRQGNYIYIYDLFVGMTGVKVGAAYAF